MTAIIDTEVKVLLHAQCKTSVYFVGKLSLRGGETPMQERLRPRNTKSKQEKKTAVYTQAHKNHTCTHMCMHIPRHI